MATLFQSPTTAPLVDGESQPLAKRYFYQAGTLTPITVYTTSALSVAHPSPVEADSDGIFPPVYINEAVNTSYRTQLTTSADVLLEDVDDIPAPVSSASLADAVLDGIWGSTDAEDGVSVVPSVLTPRVIVTPYRYGAVGDGVADDTIPVQTAIDVAGEAGSGSAVDLSGGDFLVDTLTFDESNWVFKGPGVLRASENIPAGGAILVSMAGGADAAANQAILDSIYGSSVVNCRTNVTGSLEDVHIQNITFVGNTSAIRGVWLTGFTRGCHVNYNRFNGLDGDAICINGSWTFTLQGNNVFGDGTNGTGISLGRAGNGERSGSSVVNAPIVVGNEVRSHAVGMVWNFGAGGLVSGNTFESNVGDGFSSQSVDGVTFTGNYMEGNGGDNLQLGGTNGTDFCTGWVVSGNLLSNTSGGGNNIRLQGMTRCYVGPNAFSGSRTQHYFIASGIGQYITECVIWTPDNTSTYVSNASELDLTDNIVFRTETTQRFSAPYVRGETGLQSGGTLFVGATGSLTTSAVVEISSSTGALLLPRLTTTQQNNLTGTNGMVIYNSTTGKFTGYAGGSWTALH